MALATPVMLFTSGQELCNFFVYNFQMSTIYSPTNIQCLSSVYMVDLCSSDAASYQITVTACY